MLRFILLALVLIQCVTCQEFMLFADDSYKAAGSPDIQISAVNPFIDAGKPAILRLIVANDGRLNALIPTGFSGSEDPEKEMGEEMKAADALNVVVEVSSDGALRPAIQRRSVPLLQAGSHAVLEFPVAVDFNASSCVLNVNVTYEHQMDAKISKGTPVQLYVPGNASRQIPLEVRRSDRITVLHTDGVLQAGSNRSLGIVIKNQSPWLLRNCTLRLIASSPIQSSQPVWVGELMPGEPVLIWVRSDVEMNASIDQYWLSCVVNHDDGVERLTFPVSVSRGRSPITWIAAAALLSLIIIAAQYLMRTGGIRRRSGLRAARRRRR
ncbi:MAG: hypothetical protein H5T42_00165 [Methanothrix sp.]|jgi:hypothetical protein|uniref:S-layer domain-like protein n=1 Tax=Methanothrix thermoacetophila (strain DSM 6194 / JCM 14653 / NBRC 101360 / PT) TaxID=349307 RepID=A0B864_METTP|nr:MULTISPECIES: hypothetical protein [Methanothrix]ABK14888.1 hypothetical protein Mthe_1105 [Methanothrix thermoacetophila PT]MBC7078886.1 hypothetical protein [Methanothrix sp.]NPU87046.1 hypothetical protein [Methanothrix sp.]